MSTFQKTTISIDTDLVEFDKSYLELVKHNVDPDFLVSFIKKFGYYSNPVAYSKNGRYYLLSHKAALDYLKKQDSKQIHLDLIKIEKADIIQFLLSIQYDWHKNPMCMAALLKMTLDYIATPSGKIWFDGICDSKDKEVRLAVLLGVSLHVIKCYLKLIQPGNEKYLKKLAKGGNYSLTMAYDECRGKVRNNSAPSKARPRPESDEEASTEEEPSASDIVKNSVPVAFTQPAPRNGNSPIVSDAGTEVTDDDKNEDDEVEDIDSILKDYKKSVENQSTENRMDEQYVKEILMVLNDGSTLVFKDKIKLAIEGKSIHSKESFKQMPDGHWCLQDEYDACSININFENSFFSDF